MQWLFHVLKRPNKNALKPKAASKMLVPELMEELEAQGLPTDGTRSVLYQRVQKARRINRSRNKPLWVPPVQEQEEEVYCEGGKRDGQAGWSMAQNGFRSKRVNFYMG